MKINFNKISVGTIRRSSHIHKGLNSVNMYKDEHFQNEGFGKVHGTKSIVNKNKAIVIDQEEVQSEQYNE